MLQTDIYILLFLCFAIILGVSRGLSGELGALLKLIFTSLITYKILLIIDQKYNFILSNAITPIIMGVSIYFVINLLLKIIISPLTILLRTIIPTIIDKPLGMILGLGKSLLILTILYIITITVSYNITKEQPKWLKDSKSDLYFKNITIKIFAMIPSLKYDEDNPADNSLINTLLSDQADIKNIPTLKIDTDIQDSELENKVHDLQKVYKDLKNLNKKELKEHNELVSPDNLDDLIDNLEKTD